MVKKINPKIVRRISNKSRHMRWNWEKSPDYDDMARFHVVDVDDKNRFSNIKKVIENLLQYGSLIEVRNYEGSVKGTRLKYHAYSFDVNQKPDLLDFTKISKPVKRDENLKERIKPGFSLENYLTGIYEN